MRQISSNKGMSKVVRQKVDPVRNLTVAAGL